VTTEAPIQEKTVTPYWFQEQTLDLLDRGVRFIAMRLGTGAGKTWWAPRFLAYLIARDVEAGNGKGARYLNIGRTYRMTNDILVPELMNCFEGTNLEGHYHASKEIYELPTGGNVYFRSADKPFRIEGHHARGALLDEPSEMPALIWVIVQGRTGYYQAPVLFTGYPTNSGWYHQDIYVPWEKGDPDYAVIIGSSTENPEYPKEEVERAKRTLPTWLYEMRYEGKASKPRGLVYPDFGTHLFCDPFEIPKDWPTYIAVDPAVFYGALFCAWNKGTYYAYNEYYVQHVRSAEDHAKDMLARIEGVCQGWLYDPARLTDVVNLTPFGCGPFYKADNAVQAGIVTTTGIIKGGRLKVMRGRCPTFCDQMGKYSYPTDAATGSIVKENPVKKDDDLPDCARYLFHSLESMPLEERGSVVYSDEQDISRY